jgi:hypothetical protein
MYESSVVTNLNVSTNYSKNLDDWTITGGIGLGLGFAFVKGPRPRYCEISNLLLD